MNRKTKLPKDHKLRKRLINFLFKDGYTPLYICVLLGYSINKLANIETVVLASRLKGFYNGSDKYRKEVIDEHIKRMKSKDVETKTKIKTRMLP